LKKILIDKYSIFVEKVLDKMSSLQSPEISVVMPVYNAEKYLAEAIASVLNQTYSNFELIILNDKSTDSSKQIIESFQSKDTRIVFIDKENNVGPATLRTEGFDLAKGKFIALLDADDSALPTRFEKQIQLMKNRPEIGVCGSWFTTFGEKVADKLIQHPEHHNQIKVNFLIDCTIGNSTAFFRKSVLGTIQYNKEFVPVEDYKLWSELITKTQFYIIQESLVRYRIHDTNISQTKIDNVKRSTKRVKVGLLNEFGIDENNPNIESFFQLIDGEKGLSFDEIKTICDCENILIIQNKKLGNFDGNLLEKMLLKSMRRIVRKPKKQSFELINYIQKNKPKVYKSIPFFDKIIMKSKAIFG
jgi:glycosyltransferase involved in cell wall biosynthesis